MKQKIILTYILLTSFTQLIAQQTESYTQYVFNQYALNPAVAGAADCPDIKFGGRMQWAGMTDAPFTSFISVHGAISKIHNSKAWHGVGGYVVDDRVGLFSRTQINAAYAYHLRVSANYVASVGFYLGVRNQKFSGVPSSSDPLLSSGKSFMVFPDITLGGLIYSDNVFVGLSAKQLYKRQNSGFGGNKIGDNTKSIMQYYLSVGTRIKSDVYIYTYAPSILIKYGKNTPVSVNASIIIYGTENKIGLGINVNYKEAVSGILELKLTKKVWLGYAYDFPISKIRGATSGSHEVVIKLDPCGKQKDNYGNVHCPVF